MVTRFKTIHQARVQGGFSLVELLLSVVLLMLLLAAVAFNFGSFQQGAQLDEGAMRVEAMLRYARAKASSSGRKVQVRFHEQGGASSTNATETQAVKMELVWEPNPLSEPGKFERLEEGQGYAESATDLIQIRSVRSTVEGGSESESGRLNEGQSQAAPGESFSSTVNDSLDRSTNASMGSSSEQRSATSPMPTIEFFPDGSSDTAQITLASLDLDDSRLTAIRLIGSTGELRRVPMTASGGQGEVIPDLNPSDSDLDEP